MAEAKIFADEVPAQRATDNAFHRQRAVFGMRCSWPSIVLAAEKFREMDRRTCFRRIGRSVGTAWYSFHLVCTRGTAISMAFLMHSAPVQHAV